MTSKSLRKFAGATINADDLFARYKVACDLKQPVDRDKIMLALQRWTDKIGIPDVAIRFVTTAKEVEVAAGDAGAAWDAAWGARDAAWSARDAAEYEEIKWQTEKLCDILGIKEDTCQKTR